VNNEKTSATITPHKIILTVTCASFNGFRASMVIGKLAIAIKPKMNNAAILIITITIQ
jgi:hypothetical protein